MIRHLPNILTVARLVLLPVLGAFLFLEGSVAAWSALVIYILCAATDFLDGYVARAFNVTSKFGTFLDPISDKIFVAVLLVLLVGVDRLEGLWILPAIVILMREFLVAGLREFLAPQNITIPVSRLAKWKTTLQMLAMGFLIVGNYGDILVPHTVLVGKIGLSVAAAVTVITGWSYFKKSLHYIR